LIVGGSPKSDISKRRGLDEKRNGTLTIADQAFSVQQTK
jgi:hypothetical protein